MKGEPKSWAKLVGGGNDTALAAVAFTKTTLSKRENHHDKADIKQCSNAQKEEKKKVGEKADDKEASFGKSESFIF